MFGGCHQCCPLLLLLLFVMNAVVVVAVVAVVAVTVVVLTLMFYSYRLSLTTGRYLDVVAQSLSSLSCQSCLVF